ncbi:MAG: GTP-binding protein [Candidatus Micrarchaeota archaeon]|nr:GTP-binding protein [Candidatus Micrarchaeota archaeon]
MGVLEKIKELEDEILRTQKNKATEYHLGLLKAKIAKYRRVLIEKSSSGGGGGGFDVSKSGDATVALIGFPSVGKSTILNNITNAKSKMAAYEFTTLTVIPGMLNYKEAEIQILDLPGIIEGAKEGKGRGKEIIGVARSSDILMIILTPHNAEKEFNTITRELTGMGIRLNESPPDINIDKRSRGGLSIIKTKKNIKIDNKTVFAVFNEYGIHNAVVIIREDVTVDRLIDSIEKNRTYKKMVVCINKIDLADDKTRKELREKFKDAVFVSATDQKGSEELKEKLFKSMNFIRLYMKPLGGKPDMDKPLMMKADCTVGEAARKIHREIASNLKYSLIWGPSAKFSGQRVGLDHRLKDGDIITFVAKNH